MSLIIFDVELVGQNLDTAYGDPNETCHALNSVIVHHDSFEKVAFPLTHMLNVATNELGWTQTWIELKCQNTGDFLTLIQYAKNDKGMWCSLSVDGQVPTINSRVDLYLLDHKPNRAVDAFLEFNA